VSDGHASENRPFFRLIQTWTQKIKAVKNKSGDGSGSAEKYQARLRARSDRINFRRFAYPFIRDDVFFKAGCASDGRRVPRGRVLKPRRRQNTLSRR
jgi:hypothetical protein